MVKYSPKLGDIVWMEFDPQKGKEIQKTRPALTISPHSYNLKTGLGLFMPITSRIKGYPFEVIIDIKEIKGAILCDQIRSLDWKARKAKFATHLPDLILEDVLAKFLLLLPAH
jgi:mRNA interferase MazF